MFDQWNSRIGRISTTSSAARVRAPEQVRLDQEHRAQHAATTG